MVPSAGTRFTCTFSIDRKVLTRQRGMAPRPSSAGGTAGTIDTTRPSAGASTAPGRPGGTRSGSRKKYRQNRVNSSPSQASQGAERQAQHHHDQAAEDERPPGGMRRGEHVADVFDKGHAR